MKTSNAILKWFNTDIESTNESQSEQISWIRLLPFIGLHLACFLVIYVGFSWLGLALAIVSYLVRMFAITAFYHRYFSHRTFKTNRIWQFVFAVLATCSVQRGPLWWAAHHRKHHKESDKDLDLHSPVKRSFLWSHIGWFCCDKNFKTNYKSIKDFSKYPELVFLNRYDMLVPVLYGAAIYLFGLFLGSAYMGFNITGGQAFVWGFLISTIVLFHATVSINSLAHLFGKKRYATKDNSKNNVWLAILTLGEGWHNNHHHYPNSARQGFFWWEIDVTYYILKLLSFVRIVSDIKPTPLSIKNKNRVG